MRGPSDQAKLLFFYLLRSSAAALATTDAKIIGEGHICLRLARRADVPSIHRCNVATLPENYNSQFYNSHMRQWPDLALVAEHVLPNEKRNSRSLALREPNIVGYVLGKVENRVFSPPAIVMTAGMDPFAEEFEQEMKTREYCGHVTSLAVLGEYRRKGLAAAMMDQLHLHMEQSHGAQSVGLHVRRSNDAATELYKRDGYFVDEVIPCYYLDGEDAFYMKKRLAPPAKRHWRFGRVRPWEGNEHYKLPRTVWQPEEVEVGVEEEIAAISGSAF